jgi:hypothetical protein
MQLFRREILSARADRLYGDIVLARPLAGWVLGWSAITIAGALRLS